ncbi:hypothetical protein Hanom_Chr06g00509441 [Helianthus anomalus]
MYYVRITLGVQTSQAEPVLGLELGSSSARWYFLKLELDSFIIYYLLINILNENNRLFRLASSISEARARARLLNKLIFRFEVGL